MINIRFKNADVVEQFARIAEKYESDVLIHDGKTTIDGSSIMGVLFLGLYKTFKLEFIEKKDNEWEQFLQEIKELGIVEE